MGFSMSAAFTIFAKKVGRKRKSVSRLLGPADLAGTEAKAEVTQKLQEIQASQSELAGRG